MFVFSTDEAAVYDRQIRLWGLEAQQRYTFLNELNATGALWSIYSGEVSTVFLTLERDTIGCETRRF